MRYNKATLALLGAFASIEALLLAILAGQPGGASRDDAAGWLLLAGLLAVPLLALMALSALRDWQREALAWSEQRADLALSGAHLAYFDVDVESGRGVVNATWHELLGTRPAEVGDDIHETWVAMLHPDDRQRVLEVGRRYKQGELDDYAVEYRCVTRSGDIRWFTSRGMLVRAGGGRGRRRMVGVFQDISDRKSIEAALKQAKDDAEQASLLKSRFLANISDEIRKPANGIIGLTEVLLGNQLDPLLRAQLGLLKESALAMLDSINNMHDFAHIEDGRVALKIEPTSIREIVGLTVQPLLPLAQAKYLNLVTTIDDGIPERLMCDGIRLRQVLGNLIGNAIKFTEEGKIELLICKRSEDELGLGIEFSIRDTGIGIDRDMQPRVFEAFQQVDSKSARRQGGSGLGLSIAANLIGLMGSRIDLDSTPGVGSVFRFTLHLARLEPAPRDHIAAESRKACS
jgi:PAS domain S-box-containing protein